MSTFGSPLKKPTGRDSLLGSSHRDSKNSAGDRVLAPFRSPDQLAGEADSAWDVFRRREYSILSSSVTGQNQP